MQVKFGMPCAEWDPKSLYNAAIHDGCSTMAIKSWLHRLREISCWRWLSSFVALTWPKEGASLPWPTSASCMQLLNTGSMLKETTRYDMFIFSICQHSFRKICILPNIRLSFQHQRMSGGARLSPRHHYMLAWSKILLYSLAHAIQQCIVRGHRIL